MYIYIYVCKKAITMQYGYVTMWTVPDITGIYTKSIFPDLEL